MGYGKEVNKMMIEGVIGNVPTCYVCHTVTFLFLLFFWDIYLKVYYTTTSMHWCSCQHYIRLKNIKKKYELVRCTALNKSKIVSRTDFVYDNLIHTEKILYSSYLYIAQKWSRWFIDLV